MTKVRSDIFNRIFKPADSLFIEGEIRDRISRVLERLNIDYSDAIHLEHPEDELHGDYATNISFKLASIQKTSPIEIGTQLAEELNNDQYFKRVEFVKPGFINFFLSKEVLLNVLKTILDQGEAYGANSVGEAQVMQIEFISANPTGPLTFPNARGGFTGDTLGNVFSKNGFEVSREYYINDYGNQVQKLGASVFHEYQLLQGKDSKQPEDGYKGDYIKDIAAVLFQENKELSREDVTQKALAFNTASAKETVHRMGIEFDIWFSERELHDSGKVQEAFELLKSKEKVYEKDGATWLKTTEYGDDKDRVLIKSTGEKTYIMGDIAYHINKFVERKNNLVINVWGADHHGDIQRLRAGLHFLDIDEDRLDIILIALMKMQKEGKEVKISKRAGTYILMNDVLDEVPLDVLRFFAQMYDVKSPMLFDLDLALDTSERNPVYYVQYAHARMSSIIRKAPPEMNSGDIDLDMLTEEELSIVKKLIVFPELVVNVARNREVHHLPHFALDLARSFHAYYHHYRVIGDDNELSKARLAVVKAVQIVLKNTLSLIGVSAPEKM
jgi:arginyl-tRNA synthetase